MIDIATPEDLVQIYTLCTASYIENEGSRTGLTIDHDKSLISIASCIEQGLVFLDRNDKNPRFINGILIMALNSAWFTQDRMFTGLMFYIKPALRSFKIARNLLTSAKKRAIIDGIPLAFDLFTQTDVTKKANLLKYMGFEEWGSSYLFRPNK